MAFPFCDYLFLQPDIIPKILEQVQHFLKILSTFFHLIDYLVQSTFVYCSVDIDLNVRCLYTEEYGVNTVEAFLGFVKGLIAGNSDIEYLFIDGILRIVNTDLASLEGFCKELEKLHETAGLQVEMTVSAAKENLPPYMLSYLG